MYYSDDDDGLQLTKREKTKEELAREQKDAEAFEQEQKQKQGQHTAQKLLNQFFGKQVLMQGCQHMAIP